MKRLKRKKPQGGGSGKLVYESKRFEAHWRRHQNGPITEVTIIGVGVFGRISITLDGHHTLESDAACLAQFTPSEILRYIKSAEAMAFKKGYKAKAAEIREALEIESCD
jgi:hypothetical protein